MNNEKKEELYKAVRATLDPLPKDYNSAIFELKAAEMGMESAFVDAFSPPFNEQLKRRWEAIPLNDKGHRDYEAVKEIVNWINDELLKLDLVVVNPNTKKPCSIQIGGDKIYGGRVLFRDKKTRKTFSVFNLSEVLPLFLEKDAQREEGLLKWHERKKQPPNDPNPGLQ